MTKTQRVVITDFVSDDLQPERKALQGVADVTALNAYSEDELAGHVENADALIVYHHLEVRTRTLKSLRACQLIARGGVGLDNVDLAVARECGIPVANVPDYGTEEVADSAMGMLLTLARGIAELNSRLRGGASRWNLDVGSPSHRLRGRRLGLVGLGRIGTAMALRAKSVGLDVSFYDPYKPDGYDKSLGIRRCATMPELLADAAILSLHCPLTDETEKLIDAAAISQLPRGATLINTARGGIVDTAAIPPAIASGQLVGAGIDVLPWEPPDEADPLITAWRDPDHPAHHQILINPHAAFHSVEGFIELRTKAAVACRAALLGEPIRNVVN